MTEILLVDWENKCSACKLTGKIQMAEKWPKNEKKTYFVTNLKSIEDFTNMYTTKVVEYTIPYKKKILHNILKKINLYSIILIFYLENRQ